MKQTLRSETATSETHFLQFTCTSCLFLSRVFWHRIYGLQKETSLPTNTSAYFVATILKKKQESTRHFFSSYSITVFVFPNFAPSKVLSCVSQRFVMYWPEQRKLVIFLLFRLKNHKASFQSEKHSGIIVDAN